MFTKLGWQSMVRQKRRAYYDGLPVEERPAFIKHIMSIRHKRDYQSYEWWKGRNPLMFTNKYHETDTGITLKK
jgi:hypothetical protein